MCSWGPADCCYYWQQQWSSDAVSPGTGLLFVPSAAVIRVFIDWARLECFATWQTRQLAGQQDGTVSAADHWGWPYVLHCVISTVFSVDFFSQKYIARAPFIVISNIVKVVIGWAKTVDRLSHKKSDGWCLFSYRPNITLLQLCRMRLAYDVHVCYLGGRSYAVGMLARPSIRDVNESCETQDFEFFLDPGKWIFWIPTIKSGYK